MAAVAQLFFIGTSKILEIRAGGATTYTWGNYSAWHNFKNPTPEKKTKIKYNKTSKNKAGSSKLKGNGGVTYLGTAIPATAQRIISGVERTCDVRFFVRGYTRYIRTADLRKKGKMSKYTYTKAHPRQYRLQYKDKPIVDTSYSAFADGMHYLYFADYYYKNGQKITRSGHLPHPTQFNVDFSDVRRNFESAANNSDSRDNKGSYVLNNVRANVRTLSLKWEGLSQSEGADLLDVLNPSKDTKGQYNYLTVQFRDPSKGKVVNGTFFASNRSVEMMPSGDFRSLTVTLTEV